MPDENLPMIAQRMFGAPLMIEPGKARTIAEAFGPRIFNVTSVPVVAGADAETSLGHRNAGSILHEGMTDYLVEERSGYLKRGPVAIIPVIGSLVRRGSWLGQSSGMTSYEGLRAQIKAAAADREIKAIAFEFDSPGGEAAGAFELADLVREVRQTKPVYGFCAEMAYSAAYALASQCDFLTVPEFGGAGSIGVIMMHVEQSAKLEQDGLAVTIIRSGERKAEGNSVEPLPEALREEWQAECDRMRVSFADLVGKGRGARFDMAAALKTEAKAYSGSEAVSLGIADRVADPKAAFDAMVASVIDTGRWDGSIPDRAARVTMSSPGCATGASAALQPKEGTMPDVIQEPEANAVTGDTPTNGQSEAPSPSAAPKATDPASSEAILSLCSRSGLSAQFAQELIADGLTYAQASERIIDKVAAKNADHDGGDISNMVSASITGDAVDRTRAGMVEALLAKKGMAGGKRNEFSGMSLREMARHTLQVRNLTPRFESVQTLVGAAFVPTMAGGLHTTSDFGNILAEVSNKSMITGYNEQQETFPLWTKVGSAPDFKPMKRVGTGLFPSLHKVEEGADFQYGTMGDFAETIIIATYGSLFAISRQAVINDDLSAFTTVPQKMGRAAKRTVASLVYAILNTNPNMSDGNAVWSPAHGNLASSGSAPSEASINAAISAMAEQKPRGTPAAESGEADVAALNIQPRYLLAGYQHRSAALRALMSEKTPDTSGGKSSQAYNTVYQAAEPLFDNRITGSKWFMVSDPSQFETIEVAYLDGQQEPFIEQQAGWSVDGTEFKVRIDAGAAPNAWEGMYQNPGA